MLDLIIVVGIVLGLLILDFSWSRIRFKHLTNELEQERQHNANLESDLTQANQKIEFLFSELEQVKFNSHPIPESREAHFSRENKSLRSELDQKRRCNVRFEKELATSNFSLEQARRHNKQLTGELAQANQRKVSLESDRKCLSIQLRQERENKTELEKELKLSRSSAYRALLDAIYAARGVKTDGQKQMLLDNLLKASEELGGEYQQPNVAPDYSRQDYQEAYLLRYFLPYSQPVPYLLNHLILQKKDFSYQLPEDGVLTASFFGCGPGPELYGLMHYLGAPQSGVDISAAMLDIAPWEHGRKIVFEYLLPHAKIREFKSDLVGNARDFLPAGSEEWIGNSNLIVIQHCLNERYNAKNKQLLENLKQIVKKMKSGAIMLIIERARYSDVEDLLRKFRFELQEEFGHTVDFRDNIENRYGVDIKPILQVIPKELSTGFFTRWSSNSVNSVKFIWMAVLKERQL